MLWGKVAFLGPPRSLGDTSNQQSDSALRRPHSPIPAASWQTAAPMHLLFLAAAPTTHSVVEKRTSTMQPSILPQGRILGVSMAPIRAGPQPVQGPREVGLADSDPKRQAGREAFRRGNTGKCPWPSTADSGKKAAIRSDAALRSS